MNPKLSGILDLLPSRSTIPHLYQDSLLKPGTALAASLMDWGQAPTVPKHTMRSISRHQFTEILNSDSIVLYTVPSPPFSLGVWFSFSLEPEPVIYKIGELPIPTCSFNVLKGLARVHAFPGHSSVDWHCTAQQSRQQRKAKVAQAPQLSS